MAVYLLFLVDLTDAWQHVAHADWAYLALLALLITMDRMLMSGKWLLLVRCQGMALSFAHALRSYYLATFMGTFLPTTLGADAVRVGALRTEQLPSSLVTASIVMERALGFVAASLTAMVALVLFFEVTGRVPLRTMEITMTLLAVSVGGLLISVSSWAGNLAVACMEKLKRWSGHRPWLAKVLPWIGKVLDAYGQYRNHRAALAWFLLLSLLEQSAPVLGTWLAALALHIDLTLFNAAAVAPLAMLCTRVPLSVAGFGVIEGFYMVFFPLVGVSLSDSFLLGMVGDLSVLAATVPGGILLAITGWRLERGPA
jgi:uncharacterized protein (TIRG00374 family)